jgi:hypothetical protein
LPDQSDATPAWAGDAARRGQDILGDPRGLAEIETYADAPADMFCADLRGL